MPDFYSRGMAATVRAVALAARAGKSGLRLDDLERHARAVEYMSVFGQASFLEAAQTVDGAGPLVDMTLDKLLSAVERTPEGATLRQRPDAQDSRILETPLRGNCAALSAMVKLASNKVYADKLERLPFDLLGAITAARRGRDDWGNTQENLYCARALADYASVYESEKPDMRVSATVDGEQALSATFSAFTDAPVSGGRPLGEAATQSAAIEPMSLEIAREGVGRAYYIARLGYTPGAASDERENAGFDIRREISVLRDDRWVLASSPIEVERGDTVRVDLFVHAPGPRTFVVVDDPLPGAIEAINRDLATATSAEHAKGEADFPAGSYGHDFDNWRSFGDSWQGFYHRELRHDSARFFADYLPAGRYHLGYTAQVIATGEFAAPAVRAEQMYAPEVYGVGLAARVTSRE